MITKRRSTGSAHIGFHSIDCKYLDYVKASRSHVCLMYFDDLDSADICMKCKFAALLKAEQKLREKKNVEYSLV